MHGKTEVLINKSDKMVYKFNDIHNLGYPYFHIHPYKQKYVKHLVDNLPKWITGAYIFGSALTFAHFVFSDLDVCLLGDSNGRFLSYDEVKHIKLSPRKFNYDIITYDNYDEFYKDSLQVISVAKNILSKGLKVYG